jgi:4,5-DOPA dioxygenase extradiol
LSQFDKNAKNNNYIFMTPVLFIGHGSPMNAIETNTFTQKWKSVTISLPKPKAVLIISSHWLTHGTFITSSINLETIHDFSGFGDDLNTFEYPAHGYPELSESLSTKLGIGLDPTRGLDHGAWSVLAQLFPNGDVPTVQLSLDIDKTAQQHFDLAQKLGYLRGENVLIIGSGNIVHNLMNINWRDGNPYPWASEFNNIIIQNIQNKEFEKIINHSNYGSMSKNSVPTPEHFWPLLYTLGISKQSDKISIFNNEITMGSIAMTSILIN